MTNHQMPDKASGSRDRHGIDLLTRYFLRRLALARGKDYTDRRAEHSDALVEVIIVAIAAPAFAILSFVLILSLRWLTPAEARALHIPSKYPLAIGGWILCAIAGRVSLGRKFKRFLSDAGAALDFAGERDRQIAEGQKFAVLAICGLLVPGLAVLIAFWRQL